MSWFIAHLLDVVLGQLIMYEMAYVQLQRGPLFLLDGWPVRWPADVVSILHQHGLTYIQILGYLQALHYLHKQKAQPSQRRLRCVPGLSLFSARLPEKLHMTLLEASQKLDQAAVLIRPGNTKS